MTVFQSSNQTYIAYFMRKYQIKVQRYIKIAQSVAKRGGAILKDIVKFKWLNALGKLVMVIPNMWSEYKIQFDEGALENFQENLTKADTVEAVLQWISTKRIKYEDGYVTKFMAEFKAGVTSLQYFFASLNKIENEAVKNIMTGKSIINSIKVNSGDFQSQYVKNNELVIQMLKTNLEFSRKQSDLRNIHSLFAMEMDTEDMKIGDKIYHETYKLG
jgi:hypothetical protein